MKPYGEETTGERAPLKRAAERVSGPRYRREIEKVERARVRRLGKKRARRAGREDVEERARCHR